MRQELRKEIKYILSVLLTGLIVLGGIYMPKLFVEDGPFEPVVEIGSKAEKAALAMRYVNKSEDSDKPEIQELNGDDLKGQMDSDILDKIIIKYNRFLTEFLAQPIGGAGTGGRGAEAIADDTDTEGVRLRRTDLVRVIDEQGRSMRVLRFILRWDTDWENWIQIVFDADTADIYFWYSSAMCKRNGDLYGGLPLPADPIEVAELLKSYLGFDSFDISWSENVEEFAEVTFESEDKRAVYRVMCNYIPKTLFDCKVIMKE